MEGYVKVAMGKTKADLVLKNCKIVNVFSGKIEEGNIAVYKEKIVGIGDYEGLEEIDLSGKYVCPGLIDGHVHIESSMLTPKYFGELILPFGTTTIVADPHEIANVRGLEGIDYMLKDSQKTPLSVHFMIPSCVPSTRFENTGAVLLADDIVTMKDREGVLGLGEMMNYPGVIYENTEVHKKLEAFKDCVIDGHAPTLNGNELNAYIISGVQTDHECTTVEEMEEKVGKGMYIHIREGSATRNLSTLIRGVTPSNSRRILFCTDDKHPTDIKREGHINYNVKLAIKHGIDPITAIQMATINTADCYNLKGVGAIAPGYDADLLVLENLESMEVNQVYKNGIKVAENGKILIESETNYDERVLNTVRIDDVEHIDLDIKLKSDFVKVIQLVEHNILTKEVIRKVDTKDGLFKSNEKLDILKLVVIERHHQTGNVGLGLVEGYGLKNGAVGLTIAHDSHNIIVIGDNDEDMKVAIEELKNVQGGITICQEGKVLHTLSLEVGGLMTDAPIEEVVTDIEALEALAVELGIAKNIDPLLTLAFLSLAVIPELKLTDMGLFDVNKFEFVNIEE